MCEKVYPLRDNNERNIYVKTAHNKKAFNKKTAVNLIQEYRRVNCKICNRLKRKKHRLFSKRVFQKKRNYRTTELFTKFVLPYAKKDIRHRMAKPMQIFFSKFLKLLHTHVNICVPLIMS